MYDIITIGSATEDVFIRTDCDFVTIKTPSTSEELMAYPVGDKILIKEKIVDTGGGGTNTAVAFARLGFKTAYLGVLGDDATGRKIFRKLKEENIKFIGVLGKESGYSIILDAIGHDRTILTFKGSNNDLKKNQIDISKVDTGWIYCSSMLGESFETMKSLIKYASSRNIKIAFNPSSYQAEMGLKSLSYILELTNVLVLNKEESYLLTGDHAIDEALKTLKNYVKDIVVITDGKLGTSVYDGKTKYFLPVKDTKIVETTGAGDSFASGFVFGIVKNKKISYCMKLGQVLAEEVIQAYGAKNKLPSLAFAEKLLKKRKYKINKKRLL